MIISRSFLVFLIYTFTVFTVPINAAETTTRGQIVGGSTHSFPSWFKQSFLEIADDVDEATAEGKQVMLFFDLDGCPYCTRMLEESLHGGPA